MPPKGDRKLGKKFRGHEPRRPLISRTEMKFGPSCPPSIGVEDAVRALRNNETKLTTEVKGISGKLSTETKTIYPSELVTAMRGMFGSTREYQFELHQMLTIQSSSGGGALGFVAISPTIASYGDWTALAALFDEVKGRWSDIHLANIQVPLGAAVTAATMILAFDEQNLTTDPSSTLAVYRLASSRVFHAQLCEGGGGHHSQKHTFASRSWCATATPYSVAPMGGLIGCWVYGNNGLFPSTVQLFTVASRTRALFRCRA
jgi:hypothetical protein